MKTTAVIVTYSDRSSYVSRVVNRLLVLDINDIVIVNNNSVQASREILELMAETHAAIRLINLDTNTGSAYAFNRGIEFAIGICSADYIWLLDDDNLPEHYALKAVHDVYRNSGISRHNLLLASLRTVKNHYIEIVKCGIPEITIGWKNGFRSLHIYHSFVKSRKGHYDSLRDYGEVFSVPYGGMFFHRDLVATRGSFDESYYIYLDDTEFCMRHRKAGGVILCALASKIDDLEISCYNTNRTIINFATKKIYFQMYYYIRNRVFFEKKYLVSSWPVYITNMILYSSVVTLIAVTRFKFKNLAVYYTALFHGLTGRMGFNEKYRI